MAEIDEQLLEELYAWIDEVPLSRPKKDIKRDFSDAFLVAELVHHYSPRLVELHNYPPANQLNRKVINWHTLNRKVFKKLGFELAEDVIQNVAACKPWAIEQVLMLVRRKIDRHLFEQQRNERPEAEQQVYQPQQKAETPGPSIATPTKPQKISGSNMTKASSMNNISKPIDSPGKSKRDSRMVPKVQVEEVEQELLAKEETIQILQAKIRRLEHLLHLKDIRIDDLQGRLDTVESQLRPTAYKR